MEITVANQRILLFADQLSAEEAKEKSWQRKIDAFDALSKVTSFLNRPKDDDFELVYQEHRYQPFWHVIAKAHYVYDRNTTYQIPVKGPEVKAVTVLGKKYDAANNHIHVSVIEHCTQDEQEEVFVEAVSGKSLPDLSRYLKISPTEVTNDIEKHVSKDSILIPPQSRVSAIMRDGLAKMIKGIQADAIIEEEVEVPCVDLYYRPVYAFQYKWKSKAKEAIVEIDALTGEMSTGSRVFQEYLGKVLDKNFLFDVGADAAGILIPGGSIAVKAVKRYIDTKEKTK